MHAVLRRAFGLAALATLIASSASALSYSNLIVFGDSIVDVGNTQNLVVGLGGADPAPAAAGYYGGRFTNGYNPADIVNANVEGTPSLGSRLGGDNYAYGGARARTGADIVPDLAAQVTEYFGDTGGVADPTALYLINIGGNDIRDILLSGLDATTVITQSTTAIVTQISLLKAAGASNILFAGVGNVGSIPEIQPFGAAAIAAGRALSIAMNNAIQSATASLGVVFFDTVAAGDVLLPVLSGLGMNITNACLGSGVPAPTGPPVCDGYAFFDSVHPASYLMGELGNGLVAAVPEPGTGSLVALGCFVLALRRRARA